MKILNLVVALALSVLCIYAPDGGGDSNSINSKTFNNGGGGDSMRILSKMDLGGGDS